MFLRRFVRISRPRPDSNDWFYVETANGSGAEICRPNLPLSAAFGARSPCLLTLSLVAPSSRLVLSFHLPFRVFLLPFSPIPIGPGARVNGDICGIASEFGLIGPCTGARRVHLSRTIVVSSSTRRTRATAGKSATDTGTRSHTFAIYYPRSTCTYVVFLLLRVGSTARVFLIVASSFPPAFRTILSLDRFSFSYRFVISRETIRFASGR